MLEDPRLSSDTYPAPAGGYPANGWQSRVEWPIAGPALHQVAMEISDDGLDSEKAYMRLVEEMFNRGLKTHMSTGDEASDLDNAIDARGLFAVIMAHFFANHSNSVATLRMRMPKLAPDEQKALWDALDDKELRWGGKDHADRTDPAPPRARWPMQAALHDLFMHIPGPVDEKAVASLAWSVHEAMSSQTPVEIVNETLGELYRLSVWAVEDVGVTAPAPPFEALMDVIYSAPPAPSEGFAFEPKLEAAEAVPVFGATPPAAVLSSAPSWAPAATTPTWAPAPKVGARNAFEEELQRACLETARLRRGLI